MIFKGKLSSVMEDVSFADQKILKILGDIILLNESTIASELEIDACKIQREAGGTFGAGLLCAGYLVTLQLNKIRPSGSRFSPTNARALSLKARKRG